MVFSLRVHNPLAADRSPLSAELSPHQIISFLSFANVVRAMKNCHLGIWIIRRGKAGGRGEGGEGRGLDHVELFEHISKHLVQDAEL